MKALLTPGPMQRGTGIFINGWSSCKHNKNYRINQAIQKKILGILKLW